ncbi:class I SAM-dependent methyltransferase [Patescibacteria group bacterium]
MTKDKKTKNKIKKFWDKQAKEYGQQIQATSPDIIDMELEVKNIDQYIKDGAKVLDIGCGNGYLTIELAKRKKIKITGTDYSDEMIKQANNTLRKLDNNLKKRIRFQVGDILLMNEKEKFDIVVTDRCLINLINFNEQKRAIKNIYQALKKNGLYIMCENTLDGLNKLNSMRKLVELKEIPMRWHNQYLDEKSLLKFLKKHFRVLEINNFESLYFIASRVLNAKLTPQGKEPNYLAEINKIAAKLPSVGDCAPTKIFLLKKIK